MPRNQIRVALWEYRNADGKRRLAYFGDSVDLTPDEYERAEKAGVFDIVVPAATEPTAPPAAATETKVVARPAKAHAKELWVEYAVSKGWDRAVAEDTNKKDLVAALTEDDDEDEPNVEDTPDVDPSDSDDSEGDDQDPDEMPVPKKAGLLEDWQKYARSKGLTEDEIDGLDKQELIELLT